MIDRLRELGIDVKYGSSGDVKVTCPKCSADRKNKTEKCLSVNVDKGVWQCHHCSYSGGIVTTPKVQKEYVKPTPELKKLSLSVISWFLGRAITNQTLLRYKVSEGVDYMPQENAEVKTIHFNYIYNGEVVNIKYRDRSKNFKLVSGAMLCPFGIDVCLDNLTDHIVFCEGEMDCLSYYEAGIKAVVSVPNGASKGNQKMEWLDDFIHLFEGKKIYLSCDMDEAGISLRNELARRFGRENCWIVNLPHKDANEVLTKMGKAALVECFNAATQFPVEGIDDANSVKDDLMSLYENGTPNGYNIGYNMNFIWHPGQVTLITGIPGHGKSTFVKNVIYRLAAMHGLKSFVYSAEEANTAFALADMIQIATGKTFFHSDNRASRQEVEEVMPFLDRHFKYYKLSENDLTIDAILEKAKHMVKRFGIDVVVIDNMSTVEKNMSNQSDTRHHQIKNMMNDVARFARLHDVHVILVAHPKKMSELKTGVYKVPNGYDVGDSSHWYNLPDNGLTVYRNFETRQTEVHRWKVRFRYTGEVGHSCFFYNLNSNTFTPDVESKSKFVGQPSKEQVERFSKLADPF